MLLKQMKYFVAVVDCNSFTEAAESCFISQSAVSQQIQALEKELGVKLLHRENRRFSLTPAGEYFYRQSRLILQETERILRETVRRGRKNEQSLIRVGYLKSYSGQELRQVVAEFSSLYPGIAMSLVSGNHEQLYRLIKNGEVDIVLNDQRRAFSDAYENRILQKSTVVVEISVNHPASRQEKLTQRDLRFTPCILIAAQDQRGTEERYYRETLGYSGNFLFAEDMEEGRLLVLGNRGYMPLEAAGTLSAPAPAIRRIPLYRNGEPVRRNICVFWLKEKTNYYIEKFADMLHQVIQENKKTEAE